MSGNTDKGTGIANEAAGKIKQGVGKAVGSDKLQRKGTGQEQKVMPSSLRATQRTRSRMASIKWRARRTRSSNVQIEGRSVQAIDLFSLHQGPTPRRSVVNFDLQH